MGLLGSLFGQKKIDLLRAEVLVDESMNYKVNFFKMHSELQSPEYIRIVLHYYSKVLFNFGGSDPQSAQASEVLLRLMAHLCSITNERSSEILEIVDIDDVVSISAPSKNKQRKIDITFKFIDPMTRQIVTKIPMKVSSQQVVYSVFVLLHEVQKHLTDIEVSMLFNKLEYLSSLYLGGEDFSSMRNLSLLPNQAFFDS